MARSELDERFTGIDLDLEVWFPYHLPHWSSRSTSAATYSVGDGELRLIIPVDQPLWCPDLHEEPLRVSCIQTGNMSGPLGSTIGQQPFREGLVVREEQPTFWGYTPLYGEFEIRMRGVVTSRSMFAFWMSGIEDQPRHSGEICVAEIFGDAMGRVRRGGDGNQAIPRPRAFSGLLGGSSRHRCHRLPHVRGLLGAGHARVHGSTGPGSAAWPRRPITRCS